jgi:hypothetical protein
MAGGAVEGAVEGAAYGLGTALSEEQLGRSDDLAESIIAHAGGGALLGGTLGAGLRGTAETVAWAGGRARTRVRDFADAVKRASGKEPPKSLAQTLERMAKGHTPDDAGLELASRELRGALERVVPPTKPTTPVFGALTPAGQAVPARDAGLDSAFKRAFMKDGKVDSAKVHTFVRGLGTPGNASREELFEAVLGSADNAVASGVREVADGARAVAEAHRAWRGQLATESAMGDMPIWMVRTLGYTAGHVSGIPGAGPILGLGAGMVANRVLRPAHAELQRVAVARQLTELSGAIGARAARLTGAANAVVRALPPSRLVSSTAVMLSDASDDERQSAYRERVSEVYAMAASPETVAERVGGVTAHLDEGLPATRAVLMATASNALAYLASAIPRSYQPDILSDAPATPAHERARFARVDAVLQEPLRVMEPGATPDEHRAVSTVYPRLYAAMTASVAEATASSERVSWEARRRLALLWGAETHGAFDRRHRAVMQAATQPPPPGPGRPPNPPPSPAAEPHPNESP